MLIYDQCMVLFLSIILEPWPVSSSGHALLYAAYRSIDATQPYFKFLEYAVHLPLVIVITFFFGSSWLSFLHNLIMHNQLLAFIVSGIVIQVITALCYGALQLVHHAFSMSVGFFITSILLFSLYWCPVGLNEFNPSIFNTLILGLAQGLALLPGVSRLASTFVMARWLGVAGPLAFNLSFLAGLPVNLAASGMALYQGYTLIGSTQLLHPTVLSTMVISALGAYGGLHIMQYIVAHNWVVSIGLYEIGSSILSLYA